jgi:hypothetical protein
MHAWGLRLRSACDVLALFSHAAVLPSGSPDTVGATDFGLSELTASGYPACMCPCPTLQVRGCPPPSHGSGSGWFATPFLCDSSIHCFTPVYPDAIQAKAPAPQNQGGTDAFVCQAGDLDGSSRLLPVAARRPAEPYPRRTLLYSEFDKLCDKLYWNRHDNSWDTLCRP